MYSLLLLPCSLFLVLPLHISLHGLYILMFHVWFIHTGGSHRGSSGINCTGCDHSGSSLASVLVLVLDLSWFYTTIIPFHSIWYYLLSIILIFVFFISDHNSHITISTTSQPHPTLNPQLSHPDDIWVSYWHSCMTWCAVGCSTYTYHGTIERHQRWYGKQQYQPFGRNTWCSWFTRSFRVVCRHCPTGHQVISLWSCSTLTYINPYNPYCCIIFAFIHLFSHGFTLIIFSFFITIIGCSWYLLPEH